MRKYEVDIISTMSLTNLLNTKVTSAIKGFKLEATEAMDVVDKLGSICRGKVANFYITKEIPSIEYLPYYYGENKVEKVLLVGESEKDNTKMYGYTETMKLVNVTGDKSLIGKIVDVEITDVKTWSLDGKIKED